MLDNFIKMPTAKKLLVLGLFLLLIGVAFWNLQIAPTQEEIEQLSKQHETLSAKLTEIKIRKKTYDEDRKKRDDLEIQSIKQREILPTESEMASFLNNINTVANLSGLEILSVKPMAEAPADYYARIPVQLELKGNYHQVCKFFYQIGKLDRIINVENFEMDKPVITESGATIMTRVLATTFRSLEKTSETTGAI